MMCGVYPFKGVSERELYGRIVKGVVRVKGEVSMAGQIFINRMLVGDPGSRATVGELLEDPWFKEKTGP